MRANDGGYASVQEMKRACHAEYTRVSSSIQWGQRRESSDDSYTPGALYEWPRS